MRDSQEPDFLHVVLTRFNVRTGNWGSLDKNSNPTLTDEWMEKRFDLFERFCLPSIAGQTNQDFHWFIYFDSETRSPYKERIQEIAENHDFIYPIFTSGSIDLTKDYRSRFPSPPPFVLTTRIDNDDCFHPAALERIQKAFLKKDHHVINLALGYGLQISPRCCLQEKTDFSSPFLSLVEMLCEDRPIKGVWYKNHESFAAEGEMEQISDGRYWIQVIHDTNLANQLYGGSFVTREAIAEFEIRNKDQLRVSSMYAHYRNLAAEFRRLSGRLRFYLHNPRKLNSLFYNKLKPLRFVDWRKKAGPAPGSRKTDL